MPFSLSNCKKVILVIDDELSTFKGIQRICQNSPVELHYFDKRCDLFAWLRAHYTPLVYERMACCLILDIRFGDVCAETDLSAVWERCSTIYLSRRLLDTHYLDVCNPERFEAIQKPFRLDRMRMALEKLFLSRVRQLEVKDKFDKLTKRELETCQLMARGFSSQEISRTMGISLKTVKVHRANLMNKIKAKSVAELIRDYDLFSSFSGQASMTVYPHLCA